MATTTTKKAGRPPKNKENTVQNTNSNTNTNVNVKLDVPANTTVEKPTVVQRKNIPLNYVFSVRSNTQGKLVYISRKNGYKLIWDNFGSHENMDYEELVAMRNAYKDFFVNNRISIEDSEDYTAEEVYKALQVDKYYNHLFHIDDIDEVLALPNDILREKLIDAPVAIREAIVVRAKQLILENSDIMDSKSKTEMIQEICGMQIIPDNIG